MIFIYSLLILFSVISKIESYSVGTSNSPDNDGYDVSQIHIAQGNDPSSMSVSWATVSNTLSEVLK